MKNKLLIIFLILVSVTYSAKRDYLIVTPERYVDNLSEFITFREMSYNVQLVTTAQCGKTMNSIKKWVQDSLQILPSYMLLVGHVEDIESDTNEQFADGNYGQYEGTNYPEIFVGRFPVHNEQQLQNIIDKTMYMENNRKLLKRHMEFTADQGLSYVDFNSFKTQDALKALPSQWTYRYTIYRDGNTLTLDNFINTTFYKSSPYFYIYTGHGSNDKQNYSTLKWDFNYSVVDTMTNNVFPISFGFCCLSNDIKKLNSFSEYFVNSKGGAVTYFGSSQVVVAKLLTELGYLLPQVFFSSKNVDKTIGEGIADLLQRKDMYSSRYTKFYSLLGDPGLRLYNAPDNDGAVSLQQNNTKTKGQSLISFIKNMHGLQFNLSSSRELKIVIYDLRGKIVKTIPATGYSSGTHLLKFNTILSETSSGLYSCRFSGIDFVKSFTFYK